MDTHVRYTDFFASSLTGPTPLLDIARQTTNSDNDEQVVEEDAEDPPSPAVRQVLDAGVAW
jgi:hypothetical protein